MTESGYVPTGATPQLVIQSLNDHYGCELSLMGSFSPTIFYQDLKEHPAISKRALAQLVQQANQREHRGEHVSYLEFFEQSRGHPRPNTTDRQKKLWKVFERGSVMLYFEPIFLRLLKLEELDPDDQLILKYIKMMSKAPVVQWNEIVKEVGACCYQFFGKEPELYAARAKSQGPAAMTDQELLAAVGGRRLDDSRSALIRRYQEM